MCQGTTGPLATLLGHALRYPGIDLHLPGLACESIQPAVRATALQCLVTGKATWVTGFAWEWVDKSLGKRKRVVTRDERQLDTGVLRAEFIVRGLHDRSAIVRRVAADALTADSRGIPNLDLLVDRLASDRFPSVRDRARFVKRVP
jgi:hypothetical protein